MASQQQWPAGMAAAEWRGHWQLVVTSMLGWSLVGIGSVTTGAFIVPLQQAFGWTRTEATVGPLMYAIMSILGQPVVGRLIDRYGPRPIALTGLVVLGVGFSLLGTANGSLGQWMLLWFFYNIGSQLMLMPTWTTAVVSEFDAGRGLALATTLSGTAFATSFAPLAATYLIIHYGWRTAYVGLGLGPTSVVLVLVWLFFHSRADHRRRTDGPAGAAPTLDGMTAQDGLRSPTFYKLLFGTLIAYTVMVAALIHMIPMLSASGLDPVDAAFVAFTLGPTTVLGKVICGLLVKRVPGHVLCAAMLALPIITFSALMTPSDSATLRMLEVTPLGIALGGQMKMSAYMTTRHFGLRAFGSIFGFIAIGLTASSGAGPFLASYLYDLSHGYRLVLTIGIPACVIGSLVMLSIGGYPKTVGQGSASGQMSPA